MTSEELSRNSKNWMFTLQNPTAEQMQIPRTWDAPKFVVWQYERAPTTGTPHLQGFAMFPGKKRGTWLVKHIVGVTWKACDDNFIECIKYCRKEETRIDGPWQCGDEPVSKQGKNDAYLALKRKLDEGASEAQIAQDPETFAVWARNPRVTQRYNSLLNRCRRTWQTTCIVYYGPSGTGKSTRAIREAGESCFVISPPNGDRVWWDGYDGQEHVVIDEFYGWMKRIEMQSLINHLPYFVETKGGKTPFVAKKIWITSNDHPLHWWKNAGLGAMERRLTAPIGEVILMDQLIVLDQNGARVSTFIPARLPEAEARIAYPELFCDEVMPPSPMAGGAVCLQHPLEYQHWNPLDF